MKKSENPLALLVNAVENAGFRVKKAGYEDDGLLIFSVTCTCPKPRQENPASAEGIGNGKQDSYPITIEF
jgi:hypothetical protein